MRVTFGAGSHKFVFDVELEEIGNPAVYGDVRVGRKRVDHCKADSAHRYANKTLDLRVGLDRLEVSCTDAAATRHRRDRRRRG